MPALAHEAVQRPRAVVGRLKATAVRHQLHDLLVAAAGVGHVAQGHHLPQQDAKGPDVRLGGEDAVEESLGRHPLDRQHGLAPFPKRKDDLWLYK